MTPAADTHDRSRPAPTARTAARPAPSGFTLVEMLIALVITGVMAGGVISLLMGQNRFYGSTDDAVFAEQSLRATSDLVASEVRMVNPSEDFVTANADQLTFRFDAYRGVVCHVDGSDNVWVYMYATVTAPNLAGGIEGYAFREAYGGSAWTHAGWNPMDGSEKTAAEESTIDDTCAGNGGPADGDPGDYYRWQPWGGASVPPDGAILRIYGEIQYSLGTSTFGSGTAIFRNGQELAGPFQSDAAFSYVMEDGSVQSSVASGSYGNIDRVRLNATAVGTGSNRYDVSRDLQFDIPLRN